MYGVPPRGDLQGQTRDNSNTRFFHTKKGTHIHVFLYNTCRIYMSYHILFEEIYFVLSYSTHIWNAYFAGNLLKIKIKKNEACLEQRQNTFNYFEKITKMLRFMNLNRP